MQKSSLTLKQNKPPGTPIFQHGFWQLESALDSGSKLKPTNILFFSNFDKQYVSEAIQKSVQFVIFLKTLIKKPNKKRVNSITITISKLDRKLT